MESMQATLSRDRHYSTARRVLVVAVPYSENLGDQVIADCTKHLILTIDPSAEVEFLDLAGRATGTDASPLRRQSLVRVFYALPAAVRPALMSVVLPLTLSRHMARWTEAVRRADAVVVGGGQLLQDVHLNFPIKLALLAYVTRRSQRHYSLFAVGVDPRASGVAKVLWRYALSPRTLKHVFCRDELSRKAFVVLRPNSGVTPTLAPDPALFAPDVYGTPAAPGSFVGINIASPHELASSATDRKGFAEAELTLLWTQVVAALAESGRRVLFFTNGSRVDQDYAERLVSSLEPQERSSVELAARATDPGQLVREILRCHTLVAHRLHACILGVAFGRLVVPLLWDAKVRSFFELLGEGGLPISSEKVSSGAIMAAISQAIPATRAERIRDLRNQTSSALAQCLA